MSAPRIPLAKLIAGGAGVKNPARLKGRATPKGDQLGEPSWHLDPAARRAFRRFRRELPWLKESHRTLVDLASTLRARVRASFDLKEAQELRRCLGQLGATPADESKVALPDGEEADPDDAFFGARPN